MKKRLGESVVFWGLLIAPSGEKNDGKIMKRKSLEWESIWRTGKEGGPVGPRLGHEWSNRPSVGRAASATRDANGREGRR